MTTHLRAQEQNLAVLEKQMMLAKASISSQNQALARKS
jgi:hypothetical protein